MEGLQETLGATPLSGAQPASVIMLSTLPCGSLSIPLLSPMKSPAVGLGWGTCYKITPPQPGFHTAHISLHSVRLNTAQLLRTPHFPGLLCNLDISNLALWSYGDPLVVGVQAIHSCPGSLVSPLIWPGDHRVYLSLGPALILKPQHQEGHADGHPLRLHSQHDVW